MVEFRPMNDTSNYRINTNLIFRNGLRFPNDMFEKKLRPENDILPVDPLLQFAVLPWQPLFANSFLAVNSQ